MLGSGTKACVAWESLLWHPEGAGARYCSLACLLGECFIPQGPCDAFCRYQHCRADQQLLSRTATESWQGATVFSPLLLKG